MKGVILMRKSGFRYISLLLVAVIALLSFSGCKEKSGEKADLGYISGNYQMIIDSVDEINCDYLLMYRSGASYSEIDSFVDFMERLAASSSKSFQICPDVLNITDGNQKIILLGNTLYNESKNTADIMGSIRSNNYYDYLLSGYNGNTLSVMWMSKFGREDAFNYIINSLLNKGFDSSFKSGYNYMYLSDRSDTPVVTINDINVIQYSVVMSGSPSFVERSAAERLVRVIKDATGVEIPLVTDAVEESTYEILVGDTNRGETYMTSFFATKRYALAQYSNKMILRGGQVEATSKAVNDFADMIEEASITAAPLHIKPNYCVTDSITTYGGEYFNGYKLVFSDEFNADIIDSKVWTVEDSAIPTYGTATGLLEILPENVTANSTAMVLRTSLNFGGYNTGHVTTENSFSMKYGYVEIRAKFRAAPGYWIKMILTDQNDKKKETAQIDVFNSLGGNDSIYASLGILDSDSYYSYYLDLHEPKYEAYRSTGFENGTLINDDTYHTYGVEWTPEYVRFFVDGISYGTVEVTANKYKGLKTEMYLDFMGGVNMTEQQTIDEEAMWPIDFQVDWVRVYQKEGSTFTDRTKLAQTDTTASDTSSSAKK